jgi:hypothetical protein
MDCLPGGKKGYTKDKMEFVHRALKSPSESSCGVMICNRENVQRMRGEVAKEVVRVGRE